MGILDLLISIGKAGADYAQKNPYATQQIIKQFSKTPTPNQADEQKAVMKVSVYDIKAELRERNITNAKSYKVVQLSQTSLTVDVYDGFNRCIVQVTCCGSKIDHDFKVGYTYSF